MRLGGAIKENRSEYRVDGEIGRFTFKTHSVVSESGSLFDTSKNVFKVLTSKEWYRTEGFNEISLYLSTKISYREVAKTFNRIRKQTEDGTPSRTIAHIVEVEGTKAFNFTNELAQDILKAQGFSVEGKPLGEITTSCIEESAFIDTEVVLEAVNRYNTGKEDHLTIPLEHVNKLYEKADCVTNISTDDVGVKSQKETGRSSDKVRKSKKEYVHNTIAHIESKGKGYILNAADTVSVIPLLIAFLINNNLLSQPLTFFVDGARNLQNAIVQGFSWLKDYNIVLDWYHLKKKCEYELSLVLRNSQFRNSVLEEILPFLWLGKIDKATAILTNLPPDTIKPGGSPDRLIGYFERNKDFMPCYALRKELGLRISSNKGEKANDLVVADRQKHNGMSWSKDGSVALATVKRLHLNNEHKNWYSNGVIDFKLVA
jgi:hypothetical protein